MKLHRYVRALCALALVLGSASAVQAVTAPQARADTCNHVTTTTACVELGSDSDPDAFLANNFMWLEIRKSSGYIVQIHKKGGAGLDLKSTTAGTWPLGIRTGTSADPSFWTSTDIDNSFLNDGDPTRATIATTPAGTAGLQVVVPSAKFSGVKATIRYELDTSAPDARVNATLENVSGAPLRSVSFAGNGGLKVGNAANVSTEKLVLPEWKGGLSVSDPTGAAATSSFAAERRLAYPSNDGYGMSMGWMDLSNPTPGSGLSAAGIGIGYVDSSKQSMEFRVQTANGTMSMSPTLLDPSRLRTSLKAGTAPETSVSSGSTFTTDNLLIAPHAGDWHAMADVYRTEYQRAMVDSSGHPDYLTWNGTSGVPGSAVSPKAKKIDWLVNRFIGLEGVVKTPFEAIPAIMRHAIDEAYGQRGASGANVAFWGAGENEHGGYAADVPIQLPALPEAGGKTAMKASNDALAAMGVTNYYYNHPFAWDTHNSEYSKTTSPVRAANLGQHDEVWNGITHAALCVNADAVQNYWRDHVIPDLAGADVQGMQFDQGSLVQVLCNLAGTTDANTILSSQIQGIDALATMVRTKLSSAADAYIESEGFSDLTGRHIDMHSVQLNPATQDYGGSWVPELERYTFPQYLVHDWPATSDPLLSVANGDVLELQDPGSPLEQEYARLKKALRDAQAPGYPEGFRDQNGLLAVPTSVKARVFVGDDVKRASVVYYNTSTSAPVQGSITICLPTLGIGAVVGSCADPMGPTTVGTQTIPVNLGAGKGSFAVVDDFANDSGSAAGGWSPHSGSWSVTTDGSQVYSQTTAGTSLTTQDGIITDATVTARVKVGTTPSTGEAGVIARYTDPSDYYAVAVQPGQGKLAVRSVVGGTTSTSATADLPAVSGNSWYHVKAQVVSGSVLVKVWPEDGSANDSEPASWQLSATLTSAGALAAGSVGFGSANSAASFDDLVVSALAPSTALLSDDFDRAAAGAAPPGWTVGTGSNSWQVTATGTNALRQTDSTAGAAHSIVAGSTSWTNLDALVSTSVPTASSGEVSVLGRYADANDYVQAFLTPTTIGLRTVRGGVAGAAATTAVTLTGTVRYNLRLEVTDTALRAKVWQTGQPEPTTWTITRQWNDTGLPAGRVGLATKSTAATFDTMTAAALADTGADARAARLNDDLEYDNGAGWTNSGGTWAVATDGTNHVYRGQTSSYASSATGDPSWDYTDESARVRFISTDANRELSVLARYTPTGDAYGNFVRVVCNASGCYVQTRIGTSFGTPVSLGVDAPNPGTWYRVRLRVSNGTASAKVWSGSEPTDWQANIRFTDSGAIRAGQAGFAVANNSNGSSTATIAADIDDLVVGDRVLSENFETDTPGATAPGFTQPTGDAGTWQVKQPGGAGANKEYEQTNAGDIFTISTDTAQQSDDAVVSARMKFNNSATSRQMSLILRYRNIDNFTRLLLTATGWRLQSRVDGQWQRYTDLVTAPGGTFTPGTWYRVKVLLDQGHLAAKVWADGSVEPPYALLYYITSGTTATENLTPSLVFTLDYNQVDGPRGYVGFAAANADSSFDDLTIDGIAPGTERNLVNDGFGGDTIGGPAASWAGNGGSWLVVADKYLGIGLQLSASSTAFDTVVTGLPSWSDYLAVTRIKPTVAGPNSETNMFVRYQNINNFVRLACLASGCVLQTRVGGAFGSAVPLVDASGTAVPPLAADGQYRAKVSAVGNTVSAKVWPEGQPEPSGWEASVPAGGLATGQVGYGSVGERTVFGAFNVSTP